MLKSAQPREIYKIENTFEGFLDFNIEHNVIFVKLPKKILQCAHCKDGIWIVKDDINDLISGEEFMAACENCMVCFIGCLKDGTLIQ